MQSNFVAPLPHVTPPGSRVVSAVRQTAPALAWEDQV